MSLDHHLAAQLCGDGARFVCIEPWNGIADPAGFAGDLRDKPGIVQLAPGEERTLRMTVALAD